ncbi:Na+/H+ antiporter [Candidatus Halobonum tyrrellensis]|uniref:Na+ antiporter n=1 Tax=Candidatus Halobonum tyrrellensis G22 TaxID=1324957 RepID=V4HM54_9EURY|nr:Na+/H+ antiporter [Candidatus Halobonum tyrrellensis]ESP89009.1 na+ antiporter [Candidatus Halobonum tyrrellensis G22]
MSEGTLTVLASAVLLQEEATGIVAELIPLLSVFLIAAGVGTIVAKVGRFPYTIALLLAGFVVSIAGVEIGVASELSHDLILLVILPALLFEGAATTDLEEFRRNLLPILLLAVPGLIVSVLLVGFVGSYALGFPLVVSLLFAAMILPTDPVSVLAVFDELGAPDRLSVLVEGESLINDGVGVVIFTTLLTLVQQGIEPSRLFTLSGAADVLSELVVVSLGGMLVGLAAGYAVYQVMYNLDEHMTEIVLTLVLAYGSFLLAEHYLHVSGVIATVVAGLFIGNQGAEYAMSPRTKVSVFNTWETAAFIVNTFVFVAIGVRTPIGDLVRFADLLVIGLVLTLAARAVVVYATTAVVNQWLSNDIPFSYQHVMVWGGLHGSIPIALVLGLPAPGTTVPEAFPRAQLTALVFGIAAFSLVVQGLSMGRLLDRLDIVTRSDAEELYELLTGRARAVDQALEAAERLNSQGDIPGDVYEDFQAEYGREKEDLDRAISTLLTDNPELRHERVLIGERQVLRREKSAILDAVRSGVIADDVGDRLTEEVDLKLDMVRGGESTAHEYGEGFTEFWRQRADEFGLDVDVHMDEPTGERSGEERAE